MIARGASCIVLGRGLEGQADDLEAIGDLLMSQNPIDLQLATVAGLNRIGRAEVPDLLLDRWEELGPKIRNAVLDVLMSRPAWTEALLDAAENRREVAMALGKTRRDALVRFPSDSIRQRALQLFGQPTTSDEITQVLAKYEPVLQMRGDPVHGRQVFVDASCSKCHKLADVGTHIGPDLRTLVDKSPGTLLVAMLDPNRAIEDRFLNYSAITTDGLVLTGMLVDETSNSIKLADVEGKFHVLLRKDIEDLQGSSISNMPEGLQENLNLQQMADLFAFIGQTGPAPGEFPGNKPERVKQAGDRLLELTAAKAEIYGPGIQFEQTFKNLGQWTSGSAYAGWSIEVLSSSAFDVVLDYACTSGEADKPFLLEVAGQTIRGNVASTGVWDRYSQATVGRIHLDPGDHHLTFRADEPITGPLIDLHAIQLVPAGNGSE